MTPPHFRTAPGHWPGLLPAVLLLTFAARSGGRVNRRAYRRSRPESSLVVCPIILPSALRLPYRRVCPCARNPERPIAITDVWRVRVDDGHTVIAQPETVIIAARMSRDPAPSRRPTIDLRISHQGAARLHHRRSGAVYLSRSINRIILRHTSPATITSHCSTSCASKSKCVGVPATVTMTLAVSR